MRSVYSDPVASAIDAFGKVDRILGDREERATAAADRKLRLEREEEDAKWKAKVKQRTEEQWGKEDQINFDARTGRNLASASDAVKKGIPMSEAEQESVFTMMYVAPNWKGLNDPDKITELHRNIKTAQEGIKKLEPTIMAAIQSGKGGYIDRTAAPDLFNALDKIPIYGDAANEGTDRTGQPAQEKKIQRVYIDPKDQTLVPELRVTDSKGNEYRRP